MMTDNTLLPFETIHKLPRKSCFSIYDIENGDYITNRDWRGEVYRISYSPDSGSISIQGGYSPTGEYISTSLKNWASVSHVSNKEEWILIKGKIKYDPNQQPDTEEDI